MTEKAKPRRWNMAEEQHEEIKMACQFAQRARRITDQCDCPARTHIYDTPNDKRSAWRLFSVADLPVYRNIPFVHYLDRAEAEFCVAETETAA